MKKVIFFILILYSSIFLPAQVPKTVISPTFFEYNIDKPSIFVLEQTTITLPVPDGYYQICNDTVTIYSLNIETGGDSILDKGICWSDSLSPDIDDSTISCGPGTGVYSAKISNLIVGKLYYARTYARNSVGIGYSNNIEFKLSYFYYGFSIYNNIYNSGSLDSHHATCEWGDFDNDMDLDGIVSSNALYSFAVLKNRGNKIIRDLTNNFPSLDITPGDLKMIDFNNDNNLDIFINYLRPSNIMSPYVYKNNYPDTVFSSLNLGFSGSTFNSSSWSDYDNDGDEDCLLSGMDGRFINFGNFCNLYANNYPINFFSFSLSLYPVRFGSSAWGDYDKDGDKDLILTGEWNSVFQYSITKLYRNNFPDNSFTEQTNNSFYGVSHGSVEWGDYDNDGDLDILLCGGGKTIVYRNNYPENSFTEQTGIVLPGVYYGHATFGDFNNDGYIDIAICGNTNSYEEENKEILSIHRNNGDNTFSVIDSLYGKQHGMIKWGDYDKDGDLDILSKGYTFDIDDRYQHTTVYKNLWVERNGTSNNNPLAPGNLKASITDSLVTLSWDASSDLITPAQSLSYNVFVGTKKDTTDILSPKSFLSNGYRKVPEMGNAQLDTFLILQKLKADWYYFGVQAVDNGFMGSPFSNIDSFSFVPSPEIQASSISFESIKTDEATISWQNGSGMKRVVFLCSGDSAFPGFQDNIEYIGSENWKTGTQIDTTGWYCIYNGDGNNITVTGLSPNSSYKVSICEYNDTLDFKNYNLSSGYHNPICFNSDFTPIKRDSNLNIHLCENLLSDTIIFDDLYDDPDGDTLSYSVIIEENNVVDYEVFDSIIILFPLDTGKVNLLLTIDDSKGGIVNDTFQISVIKQDTTVIYQEICEGEEYCGFSEPGKYYIDSINSKGCDSTIIINLTINLLPITNTGEDKTIGEDTSTQLGTDSIAGHTYSWTSRPPGFTSANSNPLVSPAVTTTYFLVETISATECSNSDSIVVTINHKPTAIARPDQIIDEGVLVTLDGSSSFDPDGDSITYHWTVPDGITLNSDSINRPEFTAPEVNNDTIYQFLLIVEDGAFESLADTVSITVKNTEPIVPDTISIFNQTYSSPDEVCFGAIFIITIGESGSVIIESGASLNLIAGQSIKFLSGFYAQQGSYLHGYITTDSTFCDGTSGSIVQNPQQEKDIKITFELNKDNEKQIKVYPNPNNGSFNIELKNFENNSGISIYSILGTRVYQSETNSGVIHEIKLSEIRKGIYFVRVTSNNEQFTKKIILK